MALIKCPDCDSDVSDQAPVCLRCGRPIAERTILSGTPIEPRPVAILAGIALVVLACWLIASWIPSHRPLNTAEAVSYLANCKLRVLECAQHWMLKPSVYPWAFVAAAIVGLVGVQQVVQGATYRAYRQVACRTCRATVMGKRTFSGIRCSNGHLATHQYVLATLIAFLGLVAIFAVTGRTTASGAAPISSATQPGGTPSPPSLVPRAEPATPSESSIRATATSCKIDRAIFGLDKAYVVCSVSNPTAKTVEVNLVVSLETDNLPSVNAPAEVVVPAGATRSKRVELREVDGGRSQNPRCLCRAE